MTFTLLDKERHFPNGRSGWRSGINHLSWHCPPLAS